jgi:hypothetical protein
MYIRTHITLTLHFQSGTISLAALASRAQATQARLASPKRPQPRVNLINVAAALSILRSCICTTHRETLLIINSHGDEEQEQEPTIHYNNQYWGNKEFNELLEKYKLCFEWYDKNIGFIYEFLFLLYLCTG